MWQPCNSMQSHGITVKEKWLYYILYMLISQQVYIKQGFPGGSVVKNLPASAGEAQATYKEVRLVVMYYLLSDPESNSKGL